VYEQTCSPATSCRSGERCSSQVEVVNDERLLVALPLSYLSLLLTGDFHPCPSALLSTLPSPCFSLCSPRKAIDFTSITSVHSAPLCMRSLLTHAALKLHSLSQPEPTTHCTCLLKRDSPSFVLTPELCGCCAAVQAGMWIGGRGTTSGCRPVTSRPSRDSPHREN